MKCLVLMAILLGCFGSPEARAQNAVTVAEPALPPEAHPWGRFPVDSWKLVRVTAETLDATGKVVSTSITETKSTLVEANDTDYALRVEVTVVIGAKRIAHQPQISRHSYWGELAAPTAGARKISSSELELNGRKIACEIRQVVSEQAGQKRQSVVHYAANQFPYVLKRESSVTPAEGKPTTTTVEVVASNLPQRVLGTLRPVAYVRTNRQTDKSSSITMEIQSSEVPGGVITHAAHERDAAAAIVRRSTLELVEYGVGSESPEEASPGRRRWFRSRGRRGDEPNPPRRDRN